MKERNHTPKHQNLGNRNPYHVLFFLCWMSQPIFHFLLGLAVVESAVGRPRNTKHSRLSSRNATLHPSSKVIEEVVLSRKFQPSSRRNELDQLSG